mgnify:CR=1 FL=1
MGVGLLPSGVDFGHSVYLRIFLLRAFAIRDVCRGDLCLGYYMEADRIEELSFQVWVPFPPCNLSEVMGHYLC